MSSLAKLPIRSFAAFRHALQDDLERPRYSITLGAWSVPAGLSDRSLRYLRAFGVLVRAGEYGFRGTRVPIWCLSRFVRRVTDGAASCPTTRRALKDLAADGWIVVSYYGGGAARECVNKRSGEEYTIRDQLVVVTFTEKLIGLFGLRCPTLPHGDQVEKVSIAPSGRLDFSNEKIPAGGRDRDRSSSAAREVVQAVPSAFAPGALNCEGSAPLTERASLCEVQTEGKPGGKTSKPHAKRRGDRVPSELRGARPFVRSQAARDLLAVLVHVAEKHGRAGKAAVARAALELADPAAARGSVVCWDYWLARWGSLTRTEKRRALRSEVLPGLLALGGAVIVGLPTRAAAPSPPTAAAAPAGGSAGAVDDRGAGFETAMREAAAAGNTFAASYCRSRGWLS